MFKINHYCKFNIYPSIECKHDEYRIAKCKKCNKKE